MTVNSAEKCRCNDRLRLHVCVRLQPLSVSSSKEARDLRRCVTSPPSNGVARRLADSGRRQTATLDAATSLGEADGGDSAARSRLHPLGGGGGGGGGGSGCWCQRRLLASCPSSSDKGAHATVFVKNQRVKFQLGGGHDDEPCGGGGDVITRDVIASI